MSEVFIPREHQKISIDHIIKTPRCCLWAFMGAGKSVITLTALDNLSLVEDVYPALVIAPLRVANSVWAEEAQKWDHTKHIKVEKITGQNFNRERAIKRQADIYVTNFENIQWLVHHLKGKWPYKTLIVDESSKLSGFRLKQGTQRAQALAKVAFRSKRMIQLTGTPAANGIAKLWGQIWFLDMGTRLGRTYTAFMNRWFKQSYDGYTWNPMPHAQKEIESLIKDICLSIRSEDYFPVDEPVKTVIPVQLNFKNRQQYKELEKQMFLELGEHQIEPLNAAAKTNTCLQFCNGAVYVDDNKNWIEVHKEKLHALESIVEEANGRPILVAYNFVSDLARLLKHFPQARALDKDPQTLGDWNEGRISMLLAHPASAGHGLNLQHPCNILVYFGVDWSLELHEQIAERIGPVRQKQSGYNRQVFYYYIVVENTIDKLVMERLQSKRSVQEILLEAMSNVKLDTP